jgi:hypothetical protein
MIRPRLALRHQELTATQSVSLSQVLTDQSQYHANVISIEQNLRQLYVIPRIVASVVSIFQDIF